MQHGTTCRSLVLVGALSTLWPLGVGGATHPAPHAGPESSAIALAGVGSSADGERSTTPDRIADYVGGVAARLHVDGNDPIPGEVFLLMATDGSDDAARVYERTPFRHDGGAHEDTRNSNLAAVEFVEDITGEDLEPLDLTSAPAGGDSGGVAYALGYLDLVSDGRFTAGLRVAATGKIRADGYVEPIDAVDEKTAAAALAGADVLFTASVPDEAVIEVHGARFVGEMRWSRSPDSTLAEERQWDRYREWGVGRPDGMDIVAVRHIGDVAAYLCGAGSIPACLVVDELSSRPKTAAIAPAHPAVERLVDVSDPVAARGTR